MLIADTVLLKYQQWKDAVEAKCLRVDTGQIKMMISSVSEGYIKKDGK